MVQEKTEIYKPINLEEKIAKLFTRYDQFHIEIEWCWLKPMKLKILTTNSSSGDFFLLIEPSWINW